MSNYLGFQPTGKPNYYFISYNSEDVGRIGPITQMLHHSNLPLWYDHGMEYGETWESQLSGRIKDAQAVLLFFTWGILLKQDSYVRKEYQMATQYFGKKVYVVLMDQIDNAKVPYERVPWWIDVQEKQCIFVVGMTDPMLIAEKILDALGMSSHQDKMNQLIQNYLELSSAGRQTEAEAFLAEYLHGIALQGKAKVMADLLCRGAKGVTITDESVECGGRLDPPLPDSNGKPISSVTQHRLLELEGHTFIVAASVVFHRGNLGDADVGYIWRDGKLLFVLRRTIELSSLSMLYDKLDDILYIGYQSDKEEVKGGGNYTEQRYQGVLAIERPFDEAVCTDFRFINPLSEVEYIELRH